MSVTSVIPAPVALAVHGSSGLPEYVAGPHVISTDVPDGQGYVVLTSIGVVFKFGSSADAANLGNVGFPYAPGQDQYRSITITPDGKGYLILDEYGTVTKWGSAATGPMAALGSPSWPDDHARAVSVMPDGAGYVVLDNFGGVTKFGSATTGLVGSGATTYY